MPGPGLFLFDELMDQSRHAAATETFRRLGLRTVGISHEPKIEGLLGAHIVVIIKSDLAAFAALKVFRHVKLLLYR